MPTATISIELRYIYSIDVDVEDDELALISQDDKDEAYTQAIKIHAENTKHETEECNYCDSWQAFDDNGNEI